MIARRLTINTDDVFRVPLQQQTRSSNYCHGHKKGDNIKVTFQSIYLFYFIPELIPFILTEQSLTR